MNREPTPPATFGRKTGGYCRRSIWILLVKRLMKARSELGMFDPPSMVKYHATPYSEVESPEHRALALKLSREAMVLLKNDGTLPLKHSIRNIAVVGRLADNARVMWGNYHGTPSHSTTALQGIQQEFSNAKMRIIPFTKIVEVPDDGA